LLVDCGSFAALCSAQDDMPVGSSRSFPMLVGNIHYRAHSAYSVLRGAMMKRDNQVGPSRAVWGWRRDAAPPWRSTPLTGLRRKSAHPCPPKRSDGCAADLRRRQVTERCPRGRRCVPTLARHPFPCRSWLV